MTGQHLTQPHGAEKTEASHHTHSSEGHQVPGPPHSKAHEGHGHDHGGGKVVAVTAFVALLALPTIVGLRAPNATRHAPRREAPAGEGAAGVVVRDDGREERGLITESPDAVTILTDRGEVVIPRSRVRSVTAGPASRGGIVVLEDGEVLVGPVREGERELDVGGIIVPRERVRWSHADSPTLTDEYWNLYRDQPLDERWREPRRQAPPAPARQQPERDDREGAARPASLQERRATAQFAQSSARWEEAVTAWAGVYVESRLPSDLENLLRTTQSLIVHGFTTTPPRPATAKIKELLAPLAEVRAVRDKLAYAYHETALHYLVVKDLPEARRWTSEVAGLGRDYSDRVNMLTRAIEQVQRGIDEEEAEEHEEHPGH